MLPPSLACPGPCFAFPRSFKQFLSRQNFMVVLLPGCFEYLLFDLEMTRDGGAIQDAIIKASGYSGKLDIYNISDLRSW